MGNARKAKGAKLSFSGVSVRGGTFGPTFCVFMEVWRGLLSGGFLPGRRERELSFLPARENRSPAWACARNQPRACEAQGKKRQGARFTRRRRACVRDAGKKKTRSAICPAQPRDLLAAGAGFFPARENRSPVWAHTQKEPRACETRGGKRHSARFTRRRWRSPAWAHTRKQSRACETRGRKRHGARIARRSRACVRDAGRKETRCANCPAQPRVLPAAGVICGRL